MLQVPGLSTQTMDGSGLLAGTLVHDPSAPASAHDLHALAHAVAQQTPWAQVPDAHSVPAEQKAPFGFLPHEFPTHTLPVEQFASAVQAPKHLLPLQANGTHVIAFGASQVPVVLQAEAGVYLLFSQCSAAQTVPGW